MTEATFNDQQKKAWFDEFKRKKEEEEKEGKKYSLGMFSRYLTEEAKKAGRKAPSLSSLVNWAPSYGVITGTRKSYTRSPKQSAQQGPLLKDFLENPRSVLMKQLQELDAKVAAAKAALVDAEKERDEAKGKLAQQLEAALKALGNDGPQGAPAAQIVAETQQTEQGENDQ